MTLEGNRALIERTLEMVEVKTALVERTLEMVEMVEMYRAPTKTLRIKNLHKSLDVDLEETKSLPVAVEVLHRSTDSTTKASKVPLYKEQREEMILHRPAALPLEMEAVETKEKVWLRSIANFTRIYHAILTSADMPILECRPEHDRPDCSNQHLSLLDVADDSLSCNSESS